jgi:hypothetical protein
MIVVPRAAIPRDAARAAPTRWRCRPSTPTSTSTEAAERARARVTMCRFRSVVGASIFGANFYLPSFFDKTYT